MTASRLFRIDALLLPIILLIALAPLAVGYDRVVPTWDELFFLHNAVCVNRSVFALSLSGIDLCFSETAKSPLMALLLIPAGPLSGAAEKLNIIPVILALTTLAMVILLGWLLHRTRVPLAAVVIAAAAAALSPSLMGGNAPFLADGLLAVTTLDTLLLLLLEWEDPATTAAHAFRRGALWGLVGSVGILSKLTYAAFAGLVFLPLLVIAFRRGGKRSTLIELGVALIVGSAALLILARYGKLYYAHAFGAAFGGVSSFYDDGQSRWVFLRAAVGSNLPITIACALLTGWAALKLKRSPTRVVIAVYLVAVMFLYLFIAAGSPNKDPRFFWPVWLALPFCCAVGVPPWGPRRTPARFPAAVAISVAVALSLPMAGRFDLSSVQKALSIVRFAHDANARSLIVGADTARLNIETFLLAKQLEWAPFHDMSIDTIVYDITRGLSVEQSLARLSRADAVVFFPIDGSAPGWSNERIDQFRAAMISPPRKVLTLPGNEGVILTLP